MDISGSFCIDDKIPRFQGAQAEVYVHDKYALKIFKDPDKKSDAFYEAMLLSMIESNEFITPRIHQVLKTKGWTLVMDYIEGEVLAGAIEREGLDLFDESIRLQVAVNNTHCYLPIRVEDKIKSRIIESRILDFGYKTKLIGIADKLNKEDFLCHGDFHARNLIKTSDGIAIIDWIDASIGDSRADACRTYLLYKLYYGDYAEYYLNKYCSYKDIRKEDILAVLPAVAGARLSEGNESEHQDIFELIRKY